MHFSRSSDRVTYIKSSNVNHRQKITGQTVGRQKVGRNESSLTETTKNKRQKEPKDYNNRSSTIKPREKKLGEHPIHKRAVPREYGTRPKKKPEERNC